MQKSVLEGSVEETPLALACARGFKRIVELLLRHNANLNFMCSVHNYDIIMFVLLLCHTYTALCVCLFVMQNSVPPIGFAIITSQSHIVKMLLENPALDTSVHGVSRIIMLTIIIIALFVYMQLVSPIVCSVKKENFMYTKWLLDKLGGLVR